MSGTCQEDIKKQTELEMRVKYLEKENDELKEQHKEIFEMVQGTRDDIRDIKHTIENAMNALIPINKDIMTLKQVTDDYSKLKGRLMGGVTVLFFLFGAIWEVIKIALTKFSGLIGG